MGGPSAAAPRHFEMRGTRGLKTVRRLSLGDDARATTAGWSGNVLGEGPLAPAHHPRELQRSREGAASLGKARALDDELAEGGEAFGDAGRSHRSRVDRARGHESPLGDRRRQIQRRRPREHRQGRPRARVEGGAGARDRPGLAHARPEASRRRGREGRQPSNRCARDGRTRPAHDHRRRAPDPRGGDVHRASRACAGPSPPGAATSRRVTRDRLRQ